MYKVLVTVADSPIDGQGVYAQNAIKKGTLVWLFDDSHDIRKTNQEFEKLALEEKEYLSRTAYFSHWSSNWVYPPKGDPAECTNHSSSNNLTVQYDSALSSEPYFIANRDIQAGEELTNNYNEFDEITKIQKPDWAK